MEKVRLVTFRGTEEEVKYQESLSLPFGILNPIKNRSRNYDYKTCEVEVEDCSSVDLDGKEPLVYNNRKIIPLYCKFNTKWLLKAYDLEVMKIVYLDMED